jgi:hypothetical protein
MLHHRPDNGPLGQFRDGEAQGKMPFEEIDQP